MTNEERIELCLKRLSIGKTSDVVNFSYADALAYIERLKAENAALREKLSHSIELPCPFGTKVYAVFHFMTGNVTREGTFVGIRSGSTFDPNAEVLVAIVRIKTENGEYHDFNWRLDEFNKSWWADKEAALAENGYSQREIDELAKKVLIEHFSALGFSCVDDNSNHLTISWEEDENEKNSDEH